jgi:hypothetical protein
MASWKIYETERNAIVDEEMQEYNRMFKGLDLPALILDK